MFRIDSFTCTSLMAVIFSVVFMSFSLVAQAESDRVAYEEAQPYLELLEANAGEVSDPSISVQSHSEEIGDFDPSSLTSLTNYVLSMADRTSTGEGTLVDRKFMVINDRLSLCLGAKFPDNSVASDLTFCQDFDTNRLNKLLVKNEAGEVVGDYVLQF